MKILLTGSTGFIGSHILQHYKNTHIVHSPTSQVLNLCDLNKVLEWFAVNGPYDYIIHAAIKNGNRVQVNTLNDVIDNLTMFNNLQLANNGNGKIINFCSGAAFDRTKNLWLTTEDEILKQIPTDYYGLSKNLIARECLKAKVYNLRLFGCFGINEPEHRLVRSIVSQIQNGKNPIVHQNKFMDFFYIHDVLTVLDYFLQNSINSIDLNLVYLEKFNLISIADFVCYHMDNSKTTVVESDKLTNAYTGNGEKLAALNLPLKGLWQGIKEVIHNDRFIAKQKTRNIEVS